MNALAPNREGQHHRAVLAAAMLSKTSGTQIGGTMSFRQAGQRHEGVDVDEAADAIGHQRAWAREITMPP